MTQLRADFDLAVLDLIGPSLPRLVENMMKLADAGDRQANEYLINRAVGRPRESVELKMGLPEAVGTIRSFLGAGADD